MLSFRFSSQAIDPNTLANVVLSIGGSPVAATPSLSADNTILQVVPAVPLSPSTTYTVTIAGVKDPAGNIVTTSSTSFTTGTVVDLVGPTAINSNPPGYTTIGTNVVPKFIFNEPLNPLTVNNSTFRLYVYQTGQFIPSAVTLSSNGLNVTMVPEAPLLPGTQYYFQVCCGFQDMNGNNGNGLNVYFVTGSGIDSAPPTLSFNPVGGAAKIPDNTVVNIGVNKPIDPTSWTQSSVQLRDNLNNLIAVTVSLQSSQTLLFVPSAPLTPLTTYTISVSGFTDAMGNAVVPTTSTFTAGLSSAAPGLTFTGSNIPFGSTNVSATQPIVLTFSQILDPNSVNSAMMKVMNTWNSNCPLSATYAVNGNAVTITPTSPRPAGASIYVGECGGPIDVLGEVFLNGGCYGQQLIYFVVSTGAPDTTALQVTSVSPANGSTNVGIIVPVSVTFNKAINPGTVNANDAIVFAGQGAQDRGSINLSADGRTITFNTGTLYAGTAYTINLQAGGITDASGNGLASTFVSTFTTASYPVTSSGSVSAAAPTNNATGVPTNSLLTLYLNRAVDPSTLNGNFIVTVSGVVYPGTVSTTAANFEVQFTPTTPFPNGAFVQWLFSGVLDPNGVTFNANSGTFYTIAASSPTAAPQLISYCPGYGVSNVPVNAVISLAYNLPIDGTTLAAGVNFSGGVPASITLASPNVIRIVPTAVMTPNTFYYVCINSTLKGANGTPVATGFYTTYFYTSVSSVPDTTTGVVTVGPPANSVSVGTNAYVRLDFSKLADPTSISSSIVAVTQGGSLIPGTFSYVMSGNTVTGANFSPVNPLPASSVIQIAVNGVADRVGTMFTPVTEHFTTAATPDITGAIPYYEFPGNTQNIDTNAIFTCRYNKPMDPSSFNQGGVNIYNYGNGTKVPLTYGVSTDLMSVTLIPTSPLTLNREYNYECFNALDLTGNAQHGYGGPYFFTGGGTVVVGPMLIASNPANGSTNVALNNFSGPANSTSLILQFNEAPAENSLGNITLTPQGGSPLAIGTGLFNGDTTVVVRCPLLFCRTPRTHTASPA